MEHLVAIPVYNEVRYVDRVLREVLRHTADVLVVDDGSTDGTDRRLARNERIFRIRHPENRGYGQSLIDAFAFADRLGYDWVITMDCDEQHEPSRIPHFVALAEETSADVISGSRYLASDDPRGAPPADRQAINRRITELLNEVLGLALTDAFCGFKAYRVAALRRLRLTIPGYAVPMQFWVQAARAGLTVIETPVRLIYNDPNRSFGGRLDDARVRLQHYLDVLVGELTDEGFFGHLTKVRQREAATAGRC